MNSRRPMLKLTALGLALVSACSFTVPSENEVFGGAAGKGGSSSGGDTNTSGTLGSGAAPDTNAGAGGMAPTAGTSSTAGNGGVPGNGGAAGGADDGGAGGEPPVKPTGELVNPSFEDGLNGWTIEPETPAVFPQWGGKDAASVKAFDGNWVLSTWDMSAPYTVRIYQVIDGLEDGIYKLTAQVSNKPGLKRAELYAKGCGGAEATPMTLPGAVTLFEVSLNEVEVVGGKCEVGLDLDAAAADWVNADLFTFTKVAELEAE
jgi:hypothetical protein